MFRGLTRILTSAKNSAITQGPVIASEGASYSLYPMQENMTRLLNFAGAGQGRRLTPVETSAFLYDFALQDVESLQKRNAELKAEVHAWASKPAIARVAKALLDSDFRNAGTLGIALQTRQQWIHNTFNKCIQLLKIVPVSDVPVATVSNILFAAPKLGLDLTPHLDVLLPVLRAKANYLHAEGVAEALWGLTTVGVNDSALFLQLLKEVKGRQFVCEQTQGVTKWLDHHTYYATPNPLPGRAVTLLREALAKLAKSKDAAVEAEAAAELKVRTP